MNESLKRAISGVIYIVLLITSIEYSEQSYLVLFGIFMLIAVFEFCNLTVINKIFPLFLSALFYGGYTYVLLNNKVYEDKLDLPLLFFTLLISTKLLIFLLSNNITTLSKLDKYLYLLGYIIFPFLIIAKIPFGIHGYNPKIIIGIFILIWTNDTFAYIVGKSIGKHKLFERISPKKTIEGFLGGAVFSVIASYFISKYFIEGAQTIWFAIALIVSTFGTLGDLIESKFKRIAGVKDSGKIMPGHGGVLDRLDSVIFVAPFIFLLYKILYYL